MEGQFIPTYNLELPDSNAYTSWHTATTDHYHHAIRLVQGHILAPQPEPIYQQTMVTVKLLNGGIINNVAYPGANMCASPAGIPSPVVMGIHGLWEAPLPGQHVVIGFVEGDANNAVVLNKYPYNPTPNPVLAPAFMLPLTKQSIGISDVVLGHCSGSYVALRGTLPLPGSIEIEAVTTAKVKAKISTTVQATKVELKDFIGLNAIIIDGIMNKIDITANPIAGSINITPGAGGMVRLGKVQTAFCNNYPVCMFTGNPHSTSTDVMV